MWFKREGHNPAELDQVVTKIRQFMDDQPNEQYYLVIGSDSQVRLDTTKYVTAIIMIRIMHGGIAFHFDQIHRSVAFETRIMNEVYYSSWMYNEVLLQSYPWIANIPMEFHIDVGRKGDTRRFANKAIGYAIGMGFTESQVRIKPYSWGASTIADKYTK